MTCSDLTSTLHRWVCYLSALATLPAQKCSLMVVESLGSSPAGSGLTGALLAQCSALHPASAIMGCSVKASSCPPPTGSWASQGLVVLRGRLSHRHRQSAEDPVQLLPHPGDCGWPGRGCSLGFT